MRWLCWFTQCDWLWYFNSDDAATDGRVGVYQCHRCKTISIGRCR
jgi:hypothetical protein